MSQESDNAMIGLLQKVLLAERDDWTGLDGVLFGDDAAFVAGVQSLWEQYDAKKRSDALNKWLKEHGISDKEGLAAFLYEKVWKILQQQEAAITKLWNELDHLKSRFEEMEQYEQNLSAAMQANHEENCKLRVLMTQQIAAK
jgi:hypothetical protein